MKKIKQIIILALMNLSGIPGRFGASLVAVIGSACVVGVLVSMLSMGSGARQLAISNVRADRVIMLSKGAAAAFGSNIERSAALSVKDMLGIKKEVDGMPIASATTIVLGEARKKSDNVRSTFPMFAVDGQYFKVYPEIRITAGRSFRTGSFELIVGKSRYEQFKGLEIGDHIHMGGVDWMIVGHFSANGGADENGLIGDIDTINSVYKRDSIQTISALLASPSAFDTLRSSIKTNPTANIDIRHEAEIVEEQSKPVLGILNFISYFVGGIMAVGATLGAINVMYAIVDGRKREIATLRAIGFASGPIVVSILVESLALALAGALLGVAIAWVFFQGDAVTPLGISFRLVITPRLAEISVMWALTMGLIGGVLPAIRSARTPIAAGLRAT